jgi:hypothetical protein
MSLNNSIVTQSIGIPYQQYVTSSAGHTLVSSSTYFNDTSDNLPRYKDANGLVYDPFITSSYALTSSFAQSGDGIFSGSFSGSYVGDGTGLTGVDAFPYSGSAIITGSLTVSGSIVDFTSASSVLLNIESIPLVNPKAEYVLTGAITSSGTTITLPNSLTYVSSSTYEYLEIYINGDRLRYNQDFIPTSNTAVQFQISIPANAEVTYKSLKRP